MKKMKSMVKMYSYALMVLATLAIVSAGNGIIATNFELHNQVQNQYQLSNGEMRSLNLSQDQVRDQARLQLREQLKIENCSCENISLIEMTDNNEQILAYQVDVEQEGKIFGLFKKQIRVQIEVNAETGEVVGLEKPWYTWMMRFGE